MNSKMTSYSQLSINEPKKNKDRNELSKQVEKERFTEIEITWKVITGEMEGREWWKDRK